MAIEMWLSFVIASIILCFSPGPTVFLVMAQALTHGKKSIIPLVAGTLTGDLISMAFSFIGMGTLLATSAVLFNSFKWIGAFYLIYLGVKAFRTKASVDTTTIKQMKKGSVYMNALLVTAFNPKGIIFFMVFFPLFIDAAAPILLQMLIMGISFLIVSIISASTYATLSGMLRSKISSPRFQNVFNKISGSLLVGAGAITTAIHK